MSPGGDGPSRVGLLASGKRLAVRYRARISKKSRRRKIGALDEGWDVESDDCGQASNDEKRKGSNIR